MKVHIKLYEYYNHCADGCCTNYGLIKTVNGVQLDNHNLDVGTCVKSILEHLGYEVELEEDYGE